MIEIIYNEEGNHTDESAQIKLPRNVKQIGNSDTYRRIYIEDYVMTYIGKLFETKGGEYPAGILVGNVKETQGTMYIFISGAILAQDIEQDGMEFRFTERSWTDIYEKMKQYFDQQEIVGWFLARNDSCHEVDGGIYKTHIDNFGGMDKVLLLIDMAEREEEFYGYADNSLIAFKGYYIYYEKNEAMQNYMVECCQTGTVDEQVNDEVMGKYRSMIQEKKDQVPQKKVVATLYSACTFLTVVVLAIGVVILNNYDKMKQMEAKVISLSEALLNSGKQDIKAVDSNLVETTDTLIQHVDGQVDTTAPETSPPETETTEVVTTTEVMTMQETTETQPVETTQLVETTQPMTESTSSIEAAKTGGTYYTVLAGDTLISISQAVYQTENMVSAIKEANGLESEDRIYAGQVIYLP